jgi:hypothetical protein
MVGDGVPPGQPGNHESPLMIFMNRVEGAPDVMLRSQQLAPHMTTHPLALRCRRANAQRGMGFDTSARTLK